MATFDELKTRVMEQAKQAASQTAGVKKGPWKDGGEWIIQRAMLSAWAAHVAAAVTKGDAEFPQPAEDDEMPFTSDYVAIPNVGGLITPSRVVGGCGLPVTEDLASRHEAGNSEFVVAPWRGQFVAMTMEQAFRRGLRESKTWDKEAA